MLVLLLLPLPRPLPLPMLLLALPALSRLPPPLPHPILPLVLLLPFIRLLLPLLPLLCYLANLLLLPPSASYERGQAQRGASSKEASENRVRGEVQAETSMEAYEELGRPSVQSNNATQGPNQQVEGPGFMCF